MSAWIVPEIVEICWTLWKLYLKHYWSHFFPDTVYVNGNHWVLLIANVAAWTVGVLDSVSSASTCTMFLPLFKRYMAARAELTNELAEWTDTHYNMPQQQDNSSCGVLCLMAAEALLQSVPLSAVEPASAKLHWKYIQTHLIMTSRLYDSVCDLPFCQQPTGASITWTQCDRLCHNCAESTCCRRPHPGRTKASSVTSVNLGTLSSTHI